MDELNHVLKLDSRAVWISLSGTLAVPQSRLGSAKMKKLLVPGAASLF
jgi:hypothetical protein